MCAGKILMENMESMVKTSPNAIVKNVLISIKFPLKSICKNCTEDKSTFGLRDVLALESFYLHPMMPYFSDAYHGDVK